MEEELPSSQTHILFQRSVRDVFVAASRTTDEPVALVSAVRQTGRQGGYMEREHNGA